MYIMISGSAGVHTTIKDEIRGVMDNDDVPAVDNEKDHRIGSLHKQQWKLILVIEIVFMVFWSGFEDHLLKK